MIRTFLPAIGNAPAEPVTGEGETNDAFTNALFMLMESDPRQQRDVCVSNLWLLRAALWHAKDMATRGYFAHETPDGIWPNKMARNAGYKLSESYPDDKNYIESIAGGYPTPQAAWQAWMASPSHSTHLLGLSDFYATQTMVGIAYYHLSGSHFEHYWVAMSAPPEVIT